MFDVRSYYLSAESGDEVDSAPLIEYIKSYKRVVLWGASYLGRAVGEALLNRGVAITQIWDQRAEEIGQILNQPVIPPFPDDPYKSETLVILCVGNVIIQGSLVASIEDAGYSHLLGGHVFMGIGCPASKKRGIDPNACMRAMTCRFIYCDRLCSIVNDQSIKRRPPEFGEEPIFFTSLTLVINQVCSLGCKYCTSYMGAYAVEDRQNFPLHRIVQDIDRFFEAVDGVGTVTVMGGEPFLHPDLGAIIKALLKHENCGLISISTSATCRFKANQLEALKDHRVNVSFSNYLSEISETQRQIYQGNVELIRAEHVPHTLGVAMPQWIIPSTLFDRHISTKELSHKKQSCSPRYDQLKNGKLHSCDLANSVYSLGIADYPGDYVDVEHLPSRSDLRERIRAYRQSPYWQTCGHCSYSGNLTSNAGVQGFQDFRTPPGHTSS